MRRLFNCMLVLLIMLSLTSFVKADLNDYSGGGSGNTGSLGEGGWSSTNVGIKVSIISSSNKVKDVEIFLNKVVKNTYFSQDNNPKTHQNKSIKWIKNDKVKTYTATFLPDKWKNDNGNTINIYNILADNNYTNLKSVLEHSSLSGSVAYGDYIYVEPLVKIDAYYGTAFEMTNAFLDSSNCSDTSSFCYKYTKTIFGGNKENVRGFLYTTLYVNSEVNGITVFNDSGSTRDTRNDCFKNSSCGRGIGVFKYDDIYPGGLKGTLVINKYKSSVAPGNLISSSSATFKIHSGSGCTGTVVEYGDTFGGSLTFTLPEGEYSIEESKSPTGYVAPSNKCVVNSLTITGGVTNTQSIINTPTCATKLADLGSNPTPSELINLYNEYPSNNNLLNFTNPSCSSATCNSEDDLDSGESIITGCLKANGEKSSFSENNLACFDEKITNGITSVGFCKTTLNLKNNLDVDKFYGLSGRFLIEKINNKYRIYNNALEQVDIDKNYLATAKVQKKCFVLNNNTVTINQSLPPLKVYFGDENDELSGDVSDNPLTETIVGNFKEYSVSKIYNYRLNPIYLEKLTGKVFKEPNNNTGSAIEALSSNFASKSGNIYFNIYYNEKWPINMDDNKCTYETTPVIINPDLQLELRFVDTKKPFNRPTKSNWCDGDNCAEDNDVVKSVIINKVNSYGLDKDGIKKEPIYKITLNPALINIIREYNDQNKYDYYNLIEDSNGNMVNSFIYDLKNGVLNQYNKNGTINFSYGVLNSKLSGTRVTSY